MAVFSRSAFVGLAVVLSVLAGAANAQLSTNVYSKNCPNLNTIVRSEMGLAVRKEPRMAASILRLFFHDCFVNGCDGSILLDNGGEKSAGPNVNSVRGYEVIDAIKTQVNKACGSRTVSCADILALAARDGVNLVGGPSWNVLLGRKDSRTGSATGDLPDFTSNLATLKSKFNKKNLSPRDMTALSGAHTIGRARCQSFKNRIYNEKNINTTFAGQRQKTCPRSGGDSNPAPFDVKTADRFDNSYYTNLIGKNGLLHSDQELFNGGSEDGLVRMYKDNQALFFSDFVTAMLKMGNLRPSGTQTEVRVNCRRAN